MTRLKLLFLCVVLVCLINVSWAAPSSEAWSFWAEYDDESLFVVEHDDWQVILDRYLNAKTQDGVSRFNYKAVTSEDKKRLKTYLSGLSRLDPRKLRRAEQQAFWINLYNALTVDVVLDKYPVESIRKIRFFTSLFGPWDKSLISIAGQELSLNDIEHRILRPIWQDARIHFAVNCASVGCPNLQERVFTALNTDELLELGAQQFINHPRGLSREGDVLVLSSIFDWYGVDFGATEEELLEYLSDFLDADKLTQLDSIEQIDFQYDWSLNAE